MGGNTRIGKVGLRFSFDKRDNKSWPTQGYILQADYSLARYAFGGDLAYKYSSLLVSSYYQLYPHFVLAIGGSLSTHLDLNRRKKTAILPVSETIFTGGSDSVRALESGVSVQLLVTMSMQYPCRIRMLGLTSTWEVLLLVFTKQRCATKSHQIGGRLFLLILEIHFLVRLKPRHLAWRLKRRARMKGTTTKPLGSKIIIPTISPKFYQILARSMREITPLMVSLLIT